MSSLRPSSLFTSLSLRPGDDRDAAFRAAFAEQAELEADYKAKSDKLKKYPRGPMGLVPDEAKTSLYHEEKADMDRAFRRLQDFNRAFVRLFDKEIRAERRARGR